MSKYHNCPSTYQIVEETDEYVKLSEPSGGRSGGRFEIMVPAIFWERFIKDEQWQQSMGFKYAKHVDVGSYPEHRRFKALPLATRNSGIIPKDEPFAISKYWHCPVGNHKVEENDQFISLRFQSGAHFGGELEMIVPASRWEKYTTDDRWRHAMEIKYAKRVDSGYFLRDMTIPEKLV